MLYPHLTSTKTRQRKVTQVKPIPTQCLPFDPKPTQAPEPYISAQALTLTEQIKRVQYYLFAEPV